MSCNATLSICVRKQQLQEYECRCTQSNKTTLTASIIADVDRSALLACVAALQEKRALMARFHYTASLGPARHGRAAIGLVRTSSLYGAFPLQFRNWGSIYSNAV